MYRYGIVVIGYNNPVGITRLLNSLSMADYCIRDICLIISIDKAENNQVEKVANEFTWEYGEKKIITFPQRLGLRNHILHCGDYLDIYDLDAIAVFEDDTLPACSFFYFMKKATEKYINNEDIAGISLYSNQINISDQNFTPMMSGYDNYFIQCAQSWGQVWFRNQWNEFRDWYKKQEKMENCSWIPQEVTAWPESSWKKYHIKYCVENNKYFVYPYISYSTCFADVGEHFKENTNILQVLIANKISHPIKFAELEDDAVKYDVFFENQCIYKYCNVNKDELMVDLYGNHTETNRRYLLTKKVLPYKIINSWGDRMVPHEINLVYDVPGDDIILYDLEIISEAISLPECRYQKKSKMQVYFEILDKWMNMEENGYKLQDYFLERKWFHIAVYGKSRIGRHLYNKLKDSPIYVDYFIDKKSNAQKQDIETICPKEHLPFVDVVVVTPVMEFERIKNSLRHTGIKNIIPIDSIFDK